MVNKMADLKNKLQAKAAGAVKQVSPNQGMKQMLDKMKNEIAAALPSMVSSERFQRVALTAFSSNPKLQECDPVSCMQVQFQIGYKGLLELAQRSGKIKTLYAHEVRENDEFDMDYGLNQTLTHKPYLKGDRGEVVGYYAVYHLDTGGHSFVFMSKSEILAHAQKFSKTFKFGPWQSDFDAMAKKTVIKQLLKYAPLSIELQKAMAGDETVKTQISDDMSLVKDESESLEVEYEVKADVEGQATFEVLEDKK